jgi:hypothetical protein
MPTSGGRSIGIVHSRTHVTDFFLKIFLPNTLFLRQHLQVNAFNFVTSPNSWHGTQNQPRNWIFFHTCFISVVLEYKFVKHLISVSFARCCTFIIISLRCDWYTVSNTRWRYVCLLYTNIIQFFSLRYHQVLSPQKVFMHYILWTVGNHINVNNAVFWDVATCESFKNLHFGVMCRLHLQARIRTASEEVLDGC